MKKKLFITLLGIPLLFSCEKVLMEDAPENTPVANFEYLWDVIDRRYSLFTFKNINWQNVHSTYRKKVNNEMSEGELFNVMAEMLAELKDGHVNLQSEFDLSRYWKTYLDHPENFNGTIVTKNYLKPDHLRTGPLLNTIIDSIGYIYYGSFSSNISEHHIDFVINRFRGLKGVIIDVRNNGGGSTENVITLASRFTDMTRHTHNTFYKRGPGHGDFYPPVASYISPGGSLQFTRKVAVLTNRKCYSAANDFIQSMNVLPHVVIIGDSSGGGGGTPISHELPNGWICRFSSDMTEAPGGYNLEQGIPPDIYVALDSTDEQKGIDSIIERALDELK